MGCFFLWAQSLTCVQPQSLHYWWSIFHYIWLCHNGAWLYINVYIYVVSIVIMFIYVKILLKVIACLLLHLSLSYYVLKKLPCGMCKVDPVKKEVCPTDIWIKLFIQGNCHHYCPDSKVHGANMGHTWVLLSAPDGPHVGPMNLAIRVSKEDWFDHSKV